MADFKMYFPSEVEEKILKAMLVPENVLMNKTKFCKAADVSIAAYNSAMENEQFVEYCSQLLETTMKQAVIPVTTALISEAKKGNFNHIKLFMEMMGKYTPKQSHEVSGRGGSAIEFMALSTEQLRTRAKELLEEEDNKE